MERWNIAKSCCLSGRVVFTLLHDSPQELCLHSCMIPLKSSNSCLKTHRCYLMAVPTTASLPLLPWVRRLRNMRGWMSNWQKHESFRVEGTIRHRVDTLLDRVWNVMAHAQKPDFVFRRNGRVHLNRGGGQFSRLLAAEVCASAVVMLHTPCSEVVWRLLATHSIHQFPLHFPSHASPCAITFQLDSTYWNKNTLCNKNQQNAHFLH
jgi:hypothetical protein